MPNSEYLELANSVRDRLASLGVNADDLGTKTLKGCCKLLEVVDHVQEERKRLSEFVITRSSLARLSGVDRSSLVENKAYDAIFQAYRDDKDDAEPRLGREKTAAEIELEKYKKEVADYQTKLEGFLGIQVKYSNLKMELEDERREFDKCRAAMREETDKVKQLERKVQELQVVIKNLGVKNIN